MKELWFTLMAGLAVACASDGHGRDASTDESDSGMSAPEDSDASADPDAGDDVDAGTANEDDAGTDAATEPSLCTSCGACSEDIAVTSASHVSGGVDYADPPPVGGNHDPCWKAFGAYADEVPDERWVHDLEHGGVVFLHNCDDCADETAAMDSFVKKHVQALSTPYAALPARFAVVAWGVRLVSDCYDADAFAAFYDAHVDHGPESITSGPPTSVCPP